VAPPVTAAMIDASGSIGSGASTAIANPTFSAPQSND
jgi:hypothetical protein